MEHAREEGAGCTRSEATRLSSAAASSCIYPEIERQDAPSGNPHHEGPGDASALLARAGPRGGDHCGPELLRVPSAAFLRGCDRTVLLDTDPIESAMDTGGRHQNMFRPNQSRVAPSPCSDGRSEERRVGKECRSRW